MMRCPYCLDQVVVYRKDVSVKCTKPDCGEEIPVAFFEDQDTTPTLWVHASGFKGQGKSVYLSQLIAHLERVSSIWDGAYLDVLNHRSMAIVRQHRIDMQSGRLPQSTRAVFPTPIMLRVTGARKWRDHNLLLHDLAGESFEDALPDTTSGRLLANATTALFVVSLEDPSAMSLRSISDLFDVYLTALGHLGTSILDRKIVVAYTKADRATSLLPALVTEYLKRDPIWTAIESRQKLNLSEEQTARYTLEMGKISDQLLDFTDQYIDGGSNFLSRARAHRVETRFSVVSSLGMSPNPDNTLSVVPQPRRVLDPFFWMLELDESQPHV